MTNTTVEICHHLKYEWMDNYDVALKSLRNSILSTENIPPNMNPRGVKQDGLSSSCKLITMRYLGYPLEMDISEILNRGVEVWVDYFCGDWWKATDNPMSQMDKQGEEAPYWYKAHTCGLFLALLAERWEDIDKVCQWIDWGLSFGYIGPSKIDYDFGFLYYSIADQLRSTSMPGVDELEEKSLKFKRITKSLYDAWVAAINKDQSVFESEFIKSLKLESRRKIDSPIYCDALTPYHSVVAMAARRLGMTLPELEPKLDARIILPEKLGLK